MNYYSILFAKADAQRFCPNGIYLFKNGDVNIYNHHLLQQFEDKIISTATDSITGVKLHKKSAIYTDGLPYQITFVKDVFYLITTHVDASDLKLVIRLKTMPKSFVFKKR